VIVQTEDSKSAKITVAFVRLTEGATRRLKLRVLQLYEVSNKYRFAKKSSILAILGNIDGIDTQSIDRALLEPVTLVQRLSFTRWNRNAMKLTNQLLGSGHSLFFLWT